jgi:hypothetical protein
MVKNIWESGPNFSLVIPTCQISINFWGNHVRGITMIVLGTFLIDFPKFIQSEGVLYLEFED